MARAEHERDWNPPARSGPAAVATDRHAVQGEGTPAAGVAAAAPLSFSSQMTDRKTYSIPLYFSRPLAKMNGDSSEESISHRHIDAADTTTRMRKESFSSSLIANCHNGKQFASHRFRL